MNFYILCILALAFVHGCQARSLLAEVSVQKCSWVASNATAGTCYMNPSFAFTLTPGDQRGSVLLKLAAEEYKCNLITNTTNCSASKYCLLLAEGTSKPRCILNSASAAVAELVQTNLACPGSLAAQLISCNKLTTKDTCTGDAGCGWISSQPATRHRSLLETSLSEMSCIPKTAADMYATTNMTAVTAIQSMSDVTKALEGATGLVKLMASFMAAGEDTHGTCDAAKTLREFVRQPALCLATCDTTKCLKTGLISCGTLNPTWVLSKLAAGQGDFTTKFNETLAACAVLTTSDACTKDTGKVADDAAITKAVAYEPAKSGAEGLARGVSFVAALAGAAALALSLML